MSDHMTAHATEHTPIQAQVPDRAHAFAPASVGNIGVGFDLLGHTIDGLRDIVMVRRIETPEVRIDAIHGEIAGLSTIPLDATRNTPGAALIAMRNELSLPFGFAVELHKGIPLGAGLGGSAASCVAALVAANALLEQPLPREALYPFALEGEATASGTRHGDNVAPMLLGGIVLATLDRMVRLPVPSWLHCVVVHPDQVLETRRSREVLRDPYPLAAFVEQSSHLALFITGLHRGDPELIRAGLRDVLVEPRRASLIPGFAGVQRAALDHGALGASISGAGPSVFAWFASETEALAAAPAMIEAFESVGVASRSYLSRVGAARSEIVT